MYGYIGYGLNRTQINQLFNFIFGDDLPRGVKKHLNKGFAHIKRNELSKAIEEFDKGIKDDYRKTSFEIRAEKARILNLLEQAHDESLYLCNKAIEIATKIPIFQYINS